MPKLIAYFLLFAFLAQTFNQQWYYVDYLIQKKEYLARCENKSRPQLHCDGKCLLMKKIRAQEERERGQMPEMKLAAKMDPGVVRSSLINVVSNFSYIITLPPVTYCIGSPIDRSTSIFHPPGFIS